MIQKNKRLKLACLLYEFLDSQQDKFNEICCYMVNEINETDTMKN